MSYSLQNMCWTCKKRPDCTDHVKIQDAINSIHENCCDEGGHLGSGSIILFCSRMHNVEDYTE